MRFRSLLLFACMIVVPLLAMFSHRIPPELRTAVRNRFWVPARQAIAGVLDIEPPTHPVAPRLDAVSATPGPAVTIAVAPASASATAPAEPGPIDGGGAAAPSLVVMPTVKLAPVDAIAVAGGAAGGGLSVPASTAATLERDPPPPEMEGPSTSPAIAQIAPEPPAMPRLSAERLDHEPMPAPARSMESEIRVRRAVEERLAALGAISFDCQPLQGTDGIHRCSCRVAADPTGQLQRVFQSSGPDAVSAMSTLLDQVTAWKQRIGSRPDQTPPATGIRF